MCLHMRVTNTARICCHVFRSCLGHAVLSLYGIYLQGGLLCLDIALDAGSA